MNPSLPNRLSILRILCIPIIIAFLSVASSLTDWIAVVIFFIAGITDLLDGYIARRLQVTSRKGQTLDSIADKLLITAVLLMLIAQGRITGISVLPSSLIVLRDVAVLGLREYMAYTQQTIPPSILAKVKTACQFTALAICIAGFNSPNGKLANTITATLIWLSALLSILSATQYVAALYRDE